MTARPAYLYAEEFLLHDPPADEVAVGGRQITLGRENVSNALLTRLAHQLLEASGALGHMDRLGPRPATGEELEWLHAPDYLRRLQRACEGGPWEADGAPLVPGTWAAAALAAGACVQAAELVTAGQHPWALINTRPTGHHAERDRAMGGCFLNNAGLAAEAALRAGAERVMLVDWDVHVGNGAERLFRERDDVLALSVHQDGWYPRAAGRLGSIGAGPGRGHTISVPLPPAVNDAGYLDVIEQVVARVARVYRPDLLVLAAGQDPAIFDPMGRMAVSADGFRSMASAVKAMADEVTEGRLVCTIEGGYSHLYTPFCVLAVLEGLLGLPAAVTTPFAGDAELDLASGPASTAVRHALTAVRNAHPRWFDTRAPLTRALAHDGGP